MPDTWRKVSDTRHVFQTLIYALHGWKPHIHGAGVTRSCASAHYANPLRTWAFFASFLRLKMVRGWFKRKMVKAAQGTQR